MESLVEELTCPICLDLYEQPVLLPCAHSLCKRCAGDIFAEAVRKPPPQPAGTGVAPKQVQCPSCRHEFQLPEQGVDGLRRNTTLQNIVDRYREAKNNTAVPKAVPCEMCDEEPPTDAVKTCLVCDTAYCEACLSKYHPMKAGLARHTLVEASAATPKVLMCTEHVQEKVNMYCETDECLVCSLCKLVGKHKDHEVAYVSDTFQQKKVFIGGCVAGLIQQNAEVECFVDKIQGTMTKAEQNCTDIQGRVEAFAQSLTTAIMKRKGLLQSKVAVEKDQKLRTLGKQLDQWADTGTGITAAIAEAETLLNEEDPIAFLQASKAVEDRIAAFKFMEERKLNTTDQFIHNTLRVSDLEQRVSSLDFLQVPEAPRIKCTAGRDYITVCWAAGGNTPVDEYHVWYKKMNQNGWEGSFVSTNTAIKLTALEGNTTYTAAVVAANAAGNAQSKPVHIKTKRGGLQFGLCEAPAPMVTTNGGMSVTCCEDVRPTVKTTYNQPAYNRGYNQGYNQPAYNRGYNQGYNQPAYNRGYNQGYDQPGVLGDVIIDKGRHYWEVNVEGSSDFGLGVTYSDLTFSGYYDIPRPMQQCTLASFVGDSGSMHQCMNASLSQVNQSGEKIYDISFVGMNTSVSSGLDQIDQPISKHLTKVGVVLDYDGGSISYYDQNHSLITSQTEQFSEKVCPCFLVNDLGGTLTLVQDCVWPDALK